jgi:phosphatidylserine/phosphatidylglycerophosphate/cardiolipin synthase-like enzyme
LLAAKLSVKLASSPLGICATSSYFYSIESHIQTFGCFVNASLAAFLPASIETAQRLLNSWSDSPEWGISISQTSGYSSQSTFFDLLTLKPKQVKAPMKITSKQITVAALLIGVMFSAAHAGPGANPYASFEKERQAYAAQSQSASMKISANVEVGFNPEDSGQALMVKPIESAKSEIYILAGEFTNSKVTDALQSALKRGVKVSMIVDGVTNKGDTHDELAKLVDSGATVLVSNTQPTLNDRTIIADGETVAIGSFSFVSNSMFPNKRPVESITLVTSAPDLAAAHLKHWNTLVSGPQGNKTIAFAK